MDDKRRRFEAQVLPHLDAAYSFARWLAPSPADADDVLQEAALRAFRAFDALRISDVKSWLFAIVRNCHFTALKQRQRRSQVPLPEEHDAVDGEAMIADTPDPEAVSIRLDEARTLDHLMQALPAEYREVLILREIEDLSYREIASVIEAPIGTVMSRLARARTLLKGRWLETVEGAPRAVR
ncbi:MAG TPA: sigma-70 family RNA polymerase sigma factor [Steroidobacteraceae bacterium]|jgi:RNA polymerase sigma factor (sigma-70 family)|nr:sigma-70 family RNA polymerase sigma factor [Steroidobacteraceae bacterium]